jgi:hypothetical protein
LAINPGLNKFNSRPLLWASYKDHNNPFSAQGSLSRKWIKYDLALSQATLLADLFFLSA